MSAMFGFTFFPVGDLKISLHIYIYIYGAHWCKIASSQSRPPGHLQEAGARWPPNSKWHTYKINLINYSHTLIFNLVSMQVKILIREKNEQHIVNFLPSLSRPICSCNFKFGGHLAQAPCKWPLGTKWSLMNYVVQWIGHTPM